ncbi:MAG: transcription antitermination factor NusB [Lachnospiraceae bacterium]|nr:transcription antitermination factor NusB [Lachnospiraceae bacterium]MBQ5485181.1 transcription antitermination factor NusB [Lachnospiraceae bacterium]
MTRHEIREEVFKLLFQVQFHDAEVLGDQLDLALEEANAFPEEVKPIPEEVAAEIRSKVEAITERIPQMDEEINRKVEGWKTGRMGKVDLTILRLALYEIRVEGLAEGIAINEAVEIAKKYGSDASSSFINGALAKLVK